MLLNMKLYPKEKRLLLAFRYKTVSYMLKNSFLSYFLSANPRNMTLCFY